MGIGTPVALLIGMLLVVGAVGLFFFDKLRPTYARESDKVYAIFILIAGLVTLVNWGMDAGPSFLMFVMSGMLTTLLVENIRSREPRLIEPLSPLDKRPPIPRYNARPPVQRGYRAEIDRDPYRERPPVDLPVRRQTRMNPAQETAWRNDYADNYSGSSDRPRQPYEEYRGAAGQLRPSEADRNINRNNDRSQGDFGGDRYTPNNPPNNSYNDGYNDPANGNTSSGGRYGERPPAIPANSRPERPDDREFNEGSRSDRPAERFERPADRPENPSRNPAGGESNRPASGERALNVRPYSEAPKINLQEGTSYRIANPSAESNHPDGAPA
ncbi:MAG: Ycf66 family protein [Phormidesmis sp.]